MSEQKKDQNLLSKSRHALAGACSGMVLETKDYTHPKFATYVGHPLDTVKVRLQTHPDVYSGSVK